MRKWFLCLTVALIAGGMVSLAGAQQQRRGFQFWNSAKMVEKLGLTDEQIEELEEVQYQFQKAEIELEARIKVARLTMERLLSREKVAKKKAEELVGVLAEARKEQTELTLGKQIKIRSILSLDQWKELEKGRKKLAGRMKAMRKGQDRPNRPRPGGGRERGRERGGENPPPVIEES